MNLLKVATSLIDRIKSVKFSLPFDVYNILNITKDDIDSFFDEIVDVSPQGVINAIEEIIENAYETSPPFRKIVEEDIKTDPNRLGRSAKVVGSLLKFLKSNLPVEKRKAIREGTFEQAHEMLSNILKKKLDLFQKKEDKVEPVIGDISEKEISLFQIPGTNISDIKMGPDTKWKDVKDNILFFVNKLKTPDGKRIKNEATEDMQEDVKKNILLKFLNKIRKAKIDAYKELSVSDKKWLGENIKQLYTIVNAIVKKPEPKEDLIRGEDFIEVSRRIIELILLINKIQDMVKKGKIQKIIDNYEKIINESILSVEELEEFIKSIKEEVEKLKLSKIQKFIVLNIDIKTLGYDDSIKDIKDKKLISLSKVLKEIKNKGETEELKKKKEYIEKVLGQIEDLEKKDLSTLRKLINKYVDKLRSKSNIIKEQMFLKNIDYDKTLINFLGHLKLMASLFNKLFKEEFFRNRWEGRKGFLFRNEKVANASYYNRIERIKKKGVKEAFEEIVEIIMSPDKLPLIQDKMMSILELTPEDVLNKYKKDYTGNPLGGKEMSIDEALKIIDRIQVLINRIDIDKKAAELKELIEWLANLYNFIKVSKIEKESSVFEMYKKSNMLVEGEEGGVIEKALSKDVGRGRPYVKPSEAGWFIYRERLTKVGKKVLQSFFDDPTFVQDVVEQMEKEGLNNKLLYGWKDAPVDIEPMMEKIIQKVLGKKGSLEHIIGTKIMQQFKTEFDIKKLDREIEETKDRIKNINREIAEHEEKYLPKIKEFVRFLMDPISNMIEQISRLKEKRIEKVKVKIPEKKEKTEYKPESVNKGNYQRILLDLTQRYISVSSTQEKVAFFNKKEKPTEVLRKYVDWKKKLEGLKKEIGEKKGKDRVLLLKFYYEEMKEGIIKILDYIEEYQSIMNADAITIKNLENFLNSDESKKEKENLVKEAKQVLEQLKKVFNNQKKYLDYMVKQFKTKEMDKTINILTRNIDIIEKDLRDNEIDRLYQVAVSPDLRPTKEEAQEITRKYKEKEKVISELIDRNTFKKNMNKLLSYKNQEFDFVTKEGKPILLYPENKKELELSFKKHEEDMDKIEKYRDYKTKELALRRLEDKLEEDRKVIDAAKERIQVYRDLIKNIEFIEANKNNMTEEEYKEEKNKIKKILENKEISLNKLDIDLKKEESFVEMKDVELKEIERKIEELKRELKTKELSQNTLIKIKNLKDEIYRLKEMDKFISNKMNTDEEILNALEKKLKRLEEIDNVDIPVEKGSKEEIEYENLKRELKYQIDNTKKKIDQLKKDKVFVKVASKDDPVKELSPYELALETTGVPPAFYMKELKKPKGWYIIEDFLERLKNEYKEIKNLKDKPSDILKERLIKIRDTMEALESYKNLPIIKIRGEQVSFRDIVNRFEDILQEYSSTFKRLISQREDAIKRIVSLQQQRDYLDKLFDPETKEFKGFEKEEIDNFKGIFLRMLYRDLDRYWATRVGKNLSVFGERDTDWYNNVYNTFKNLAYAKSNRKIIDLINRYKKEVRSELDDVVNRLKIDELKKRLNTIIETYKEISEDKLKELRSKKKEIIKKLKEQGKDPSIDPVIIDLDKKISFLETYGIDPTKNETVKELISKIETLEKKKKQINKLFEIMGTASATALHAEFEKKLKERVKNLSKEEDFKETKVDLNKKADEIIDKASEEFEENMDDIIDLSKILEDVETRIEKGEEKLRIKKVAVYNKEHPDFNMRILYGNEIQRTIQYLMKRELCKVA